MRPLPLDAIRGFSGLPEEAPGSARRARRPGASDPAHSANGCPSGSGASCPQPRLHGTPGVARGAEPPAVSRVKVRSAVRARDDVVHVRRGLDAPVLVAVLAERVSGRVRAASVGAGRGEEPSAEALPRGRAVEAPALDRVRGTRLLTVHGTAPALDDDGAARLGAGAEWGLQSGILSPAALTGQPSR